MTFIRKHWIAVVALTPVALFVLWLAVCYGYAIATDWYDTVTIKHLVFLILLRLLFMGGRKCSCS